MKLADIIHKPRPLHSWKDAEKIPWNDPAFSERMLQNHLAQEHDWASRRLSLIDRQVAWLQRQLSAQAKILDLGCVPGLYLQRLARAGFQCTGVDFSPASINYARQQAANEGLDIHYHCQDIRQFKHKERYNCVMMTFGEFNVFSKTDGLALLDQMANALLPSGLLVLELHTPEEVKRQGETASRWESHQQGLFSPTPHLVLTENSWDEQRHTASAAWWIIEATGEVSLFASHMQAWSDEECRQCLQTLGVDHITQLAASDWPAGDIFAEKLYVLQGVKKA
ncbi:SAM-dependent methlyltransferase [Chania multitudinisentens RB-25]|uniref:SAM-dependent methlyltransferase n=1 Tax=Chania multitudinisentens RB-25 TaxID=1441930 RepID=W0LG82_9GAMM|nr:class I SAM-dependent methyltransferase [Chania multitudinisentens]AHG21369.1 SAM-dependent methlyltransferase [Chania multitudinisentens RB-25]